MRQDGKLPGSCSRDEAQTLQAASLLPGGSEAMEGYERLLSGPALWPREVGWAGEGLVSLHRSLEVPQGGSRSFASLRGS